MAKEDYLIKLSMLEQEANKIREQVQIINQQIQEFEVLKLSLEKIDDMSEKEILAPLGKGVFFKADLKEKELFVNVGRNVVLKKTPKETCEIIDNQCKELEELRKSLSNEIGKINVQLQELVEKAQKNNEK